MLSGCTKEHAETGPPQSDSELATLASPYTKPTYSDQGIEPDRSIANDLWVSIPKALQFPGLSRVEIATSWRARMAKFSKADQAYLEGVSERYFESLEFRDETEQRCLIQQGFPMPEEWMAARNVPDGELERLAMAGNLKAQMFQIDRMSEILAPILGVRGFDNNSTDKELFRRMVETSNMLDSLVGSGQSPFSAYLSGRYISATQGYGKGNPVEPIAASFQFARDFGDERASQYSNTFFQRYPEMDAERVMSAYSSMKADTKDPRQAIRTRGETSCLSRS